MSQELPAPRIRFATAEDADAMLRLATGHASEMHFGAPSPRRIGEMARMVFERGKVLLSLDDDGTPVGQIALVIEQPVWSEDWMVSDMSFYVMPQHRHRRHARGLLLAAKDYAKAMGLPLMVSLWGRRIEGKARLMRRDLGDPSGAIFFIPAEG